MITKLSEVWPAVEAVAKRHGVAHIGASDLRDEHAALFEEWIAGGHHATMRYLEKNRAVRNDPERRFPWAKSIIAILVPYAGERPQADQNSLSHRIARYAMGDDYHGVLDRILRDIEQVVEGKSWRYVDTGPLSDRSAAAQAGLGWIGRNGMLIHVEHGSYFFIGTLVTSLENDIVSTEVTDRCGTCTRCVEACPTHAILPNRTVASERCISYATIEHRGPLPDIALDGNVFGCDICQEVCPWNQAPLEPHPAFIARDAYRATPVTDLLRFEQADFSRLFVRSAIKRTRLDGLKRNVGLVVGRGS
jgi:epoxyqueuosine reductase